MTKNDLREELKQSMLTKDELKTSVLRMLLSALSYYEINKGGIGYETTDEDILSVIEKEIKQHNDSIEQFTNAGRLELADKETKEVEILKRYMPEQMSEEEIKNLAKEAISQTGATAIKDMGKVMSILMPEIKGRADGSLVSKIVKDSLT